MGGLVAPYSQNFKSASIDGEMLFRLNDEDIESLGVDKPVARKKILLELEKLKAKTFVP